ncbi:VanZ family protein [Falsarthrobacter nasiphocae]|uniref:VanZ family protein n=1 Tax=Falsarthrobacter nasiphocae TaxID=189863 RepID=A0AAE4C736_9MICC|nr:VanZ family protein [Falsarthrobacter nasiphocae]MDR6892119.1 VanZ family protein [Falsarthrobacter nasiphocae]
MRHFLASRSVSQRVMLVFGLTAVLLQLRSLYGEVNGSSPFPGLPVDKAVHFTIFALPVFFLLRAGLNRLAVLGAFVVHAPLSEVLQGMFFPGRSADPLDAVADFAGIAVALLSASWLSRRQQREASAPPPRSPGA